MITPQAGRGESGQAAAADVADAAGSADDLESIGVVVTGCSAVAALSGQFRSYLPGRIVAGVRADEDRIEVHVVAHYGQPMAAIAEQIAFALSPLLRGRALTVGIDDIVLPGDQDPADSVTPPDSPGGSAGVGSAGAS